MERDVDIQDFINLLERQDDFDVKHSKAEVVARVAEAIADFIRMY